MPEIWIDVDTAVVVPVNLLPLIDDTDFKAIEASVAYNAAGMDLNWNFQTTAGVKTQTNVVPTTGGVYDWSNEGNGMYGMEIPASGGGSINNDTEGVGWWSGVCNGVLPWRGPAIGFRAAAINNTMVDGPTGPNVTVPDAAGIAATASVVGALDNAAAAGEVTNADTLMQYLKQLINILIGDPGVVTFKAEAAPGDAISLSEVIRAIHADVTGLNGASGSAWITATGFSTHNAAGVKSAIEAGGSHLTLIKAITDALPNSGALSDIATNAARLTAVRAAVLTDLIDGGRLDLLIDAIKAKTDELIIHETTIASVTDDKTFVLTASGLDGDTSADDDAWNDASVVITDVTGTAKELRKVTDYGGVSKQIVLDRVCKFNLAAGDKVKFYPAYTSTASAGSVTQQNIDDIVAGVYNANDMDFVAQGSKGQKIHHSGRGRY